MICHRVADRDLMGLLIRAHSTAPNGRTEFVASTATEDRAGDIVAQDWDLSAWRANPVILWSHDASVPPIGRGTEAGVVDGALRIVVEWDMDDPLGASVARKFEKGYLSASSVGFRSHAMRWRAQLPADHPAYVKSDEPWSAGMLFERNELMEHSAVSIPMNGEALAQRAARLDVRDPAAKLLENARAVEALADAVARHMAGQPDPTPSSDLASWFAKGA